MNAERVRVRLREVLGPLAPFADTLLSDDTAATLAAVSRSEAALREALARETDAGARAAGYDRLHACRVLAEMVAWDLAGPQRTLSEESAPVTIEGSRPAPGGWALELRALRGTGSLVLEGPGARVVIPPLAVGQRHRTLLPGRPAPGVATVFSGEQRWSLELPAPGEEAGLEG